MPRWKHAVLDNRFLKRLQLAHAVASPLTLLKSPRSLFGYGIVGAQVNMEASSICQLKCPACRNGRRLIATGTIGQGYLSFDDFKRFVNQNSWIRSIELSNWGELFLNPELDKIIKYAFTKKVMLTAYNGVNLNTVDDTMIQSLVQHRFDHLTVSIDGATPRVYRMYRRSGSLDRVLQNIRAINHYKWLYKTNRPTLTWQFIIFGHNEYELPAARRMAASMGMRFVPKLNYNEEYSPVRDQQWVRKESGLGAATREEYRRLYHRDYLSPCHQLWYSPQINWDGKLLGCCVNKHGDFGNVFSSGLQSCMKSERYLYAKRMVFGLAPLRTDIPCAQCPVYRERQHSTDRSVS